MSIDPPNSVVQPPAAPLVSERLQQPLILDPGSIHDGAFREMPRSAEHRRCVASPHPVDREVQAAHEAGWLALHYGACRVTLPDGRVWLFEARVLEGAR